MYFHMSAQVYTRRAYLSTCRDVYISLTNYQQQKGSLNCNVTKLQDPHPVIDPLVTTAMESGPIVRTARRRRRRLASFPARATDIFPRARRGGAGRPAGKALLPHARNVRVVFVLVVWLFARPRPVASPLLLRHLNKPQLD
jgi:hypothetical protein